MPTARADAPFPVPVVVNAGVAVSQPSSSRSNVPATSCSPGLWVVAPVVSDHFLFSLIYAGGLHGAPLYVCPRYSHV